MTGAELRARRVTLAVTRSELARTANRSVWCVRSLELASRRGTPATWRAIEGALRVCAATRGVAVEAELEELPS